MTYKQFYELASIERLRNKDPLHNHGKNCAELYRHPVQSILVSLELLSLCSVWSKENDLSLEPLEEQWCYRKIKRIVQNKENDCKCVKIIGLSVAQRLEMMFFAMKKLCICAKKNGSLL